jgi:hypothetical protein
MCRPIVSLLFFFHRMNTAFYYTPESPDIHHSYYQNMPIYYSFGNGNTKLSWFHLIIQKVLGTLIALNYF